MIRNIFFIALVSGIFSLVSTSVVAQTDTARVTTQEAIKAERQVAKELAQQNEDQMKAQSRTNQDKLKDMESLEKENKAKAKEARRVNNEASDAAKQSKRAANSERSAQKSRIRADKQAKKATKATEKSNGN